MSLKTPARKPAPGNPFMIYGGTQPQVPPLPALSLQSSDAVNPGVLRLARAKRAYTARRRRLAVLLSVLLMAVALWVMVPVVKHFWEPPPVKASPVVAPVRFSYISSVFGRRWGRMHEGIDLAAASGTPIHAASPGKVIHSGWEAGYGRSVVIDHGNGIQTRYAHCSKVLAKPGQKVPKGGLIAKVGSTGHSTGPHLHFEVLVNGQRKNPQWYYRFDNQPHTVETLSPLQQYLKEFQRRVPGLYQQSVAWIRPILPKPTS